MATNGSVWVEGTELHFVDGNGDEYRYTDAELINANSTGQPGSIWIENQGDGDSAITYVDENLDKTSAGLLDHNDHQDSHQDQHTDQFDNHTDQFDNHQDNHQDNHDDRFDNHANSHSNQFGNHSNSFGNHSNSHSDDHTDSHSDNHTDQFDDHSDVPHDDHSDHADEPVIT